MQILSEPDYNSHLHKLNLTSGRFIIRYESNTEEYNYVRCVKTFLLQELMALKSLLFLTPSTIRPLIGGILNRKLKVGLSALNWTEMIFVAWISFLFFGLFYSFLARSQSTKHLRLRERTSFPLHCQTTKQWRQRDTLSNREDNSLYTKVYFRTFTCQQTVSRQNVYIVCWRNVMYKTQAVIVWINDRCFIIN